MKYRSLCGFVFGLLCAAMLAACQPASTPEINIEQAVGAPAIDTTAGAMYMIIKNSGNEADKLLSGKSPACGSIEVHEMVMKTDGTMGMNLLDEPLEIPANDQVELKKGGIHVMCILKNEQFQPGAKIDLTLNFDKAGEKTFSVMIQN